MNEPHQSDTEKKLSAARTKLILDKPFLGALVLQLPLIPAEGSWCRTTATDAKNIYYNPRYIETLDTSQTQFILAHDALHCALSHFHRRQHRNKQRWDLACDYAVNQILLGENLEAPPGALVNDAFCGMTAEEIYPSIEINCEDETLDEHVYDQNADTNPEEKENSKPLNTKPNNSTENSEETQPVKPKPLSHQEKDALNQQWQQRLAAAAQQAKMAGKLSEGLSRLIDVSIQAKQSWRQILAQHMSSLAKEDYSYTRPSNRREGAAFFPSLRSQQINIIAAIDTSGSVSDSELSEFAAEINAIKANVNARVTLIACDKQIDSRGPWQFEPWDAFTLPNTLKGGGSTDFRPVFQWVQKQDITPDIMIYFTDAKGKFPEHPPPTQVIWLVKGKTPIPWGHRIQLN